MFINAAFIFKILNSSELCKLDMYRVCKQYRYMCKLLWNNCFIKKLSISDSSIGNSTCTDDDRYVRIVVTIIQSSSTWMYRHRLIIWFAHTWATRRVHNLLTLPEYLRSPPFFCRVRVAQSLVFYAVNCVLSFFFLSFSFLCRDIVSLLSTRQLECPFGIFCLSLNTPRHLSR